MSNHPVLSIVDAHLCSGCGACAYAAPKRITMVDTLEQGRRPRIGDGDAEGLADARDVCPGLGLTRRMVDDGSTPIPELLDTWGPILEVWEGFAVDPEIRFRGSSGGVVTAMASYCLEQAGMEGAVHVRAREDAPLLNETVFSRDREELLAGSGSRYAPASPCDGLGDVEAADAPCVFIGKPCDVTGAENARRIRPALDRNLGLTMAVFCAGTPALTGTHELARRLGADDPEEISEVRYRGRGWPGEMSVTRRDPITGESTTETTTYERGWGDVLQKHRQWRCRICADHTGELADLSVGDPWYRPREDGDPGCSLVLVRTERGRRLLRAAMEAGFVQLERREPEVLDASQPHLLRNQRNMWGRLLAHRLLGLPTPRYRGLRLAKLWLRGLSLTERLRSVAGTVRRLWKRRLWHPERSTDITSRESVSV